MADLTRHLRPGDVDGAQSVAVPCGEDQVLENRRIVVLLRNAPAPLSRIVLHEDRSTLTLGTSAAARSAAPSIGERSSE